jgi:glutathione synthase/RimK-type ligase-like ATP-grasp enzyme
MTVILRRRKLGRTSCKEIVRLSNTGIVSVRNDQAFPEGHELVIRWGTTSNLPYRASVLNEAAAIHWVADKATSRKLMADKGLAPKTWLSGQQWGLDVGADFTPEMDVKVIVRKRNHSQGKHLLFCVNIGEVYDACEAYGEGDYYISEFIDKVAEYRVFVTSGRVSCVAKKTPADENAIAWNVAQGGRFDNVRWNDWPLEAIRVAVEAFNMSGLDFGGVDVMCDADGKAYVLEINSAPSLTSPYRQECMAKYFDYVVTHGKEHIAVADYNSYLGCVHPAITDKARLMEMDNAA